MRRSTGAPLLIGVLCLSGCAIQAEAGSFAELSAPSPSEDTAFVTERQALAAYNNMWEAVIEGTHRGRVVQPDLSLYARGQALEFAAAMLNGQEGRGRPVFSPEAERLGRAEGAPAVWVRDCMDDSQWRVVRKGSDTDDPDTRARQDARRAGPREIRAMVVEDEKSGWQVERLRLGDYGSC
ncbi:hypothetical protein [Actinorugispora endophytica]|uniref:Mce-associated membrane protein n=1 Tax=Actinorugispora endophytica TaxID=1605990 RepID=A0A4R6UZX6_9ACTN|nr:hypothetical protein [Actinorugispora endophytica]TDQ53034.1 hypothetical protein EV190_105152 [Actinorugispora endophytica]